MSPLPYKCLNCGAERDIMPQPRRATFDSPAAVLCPECDAAMLEPMSADERNRLRQEFIDFANKAMAEVDRREYFKTAVEREVAAGRTKEIAEHFQVAESTVRRRAKGVVRPLPRMQIDVIAFINQKKEGAK